MEIKVKKNNLFTLKENALLLITSDFKIDPESMLFQKQGLFGVNTKGELSWINLLKDFNQWSKDPEADTAYVKLLKFYQNHFQQIKKSILEENCIICREMLAPRTILFFRCCFYLSCFDCLENNNGKCFLCGKFLQMEQCLVFEQPEPDEVLCRTAVPNDTYCKTVVNLLSEHSSNGSSPYMKEINLLRVVNYLLDKCDFGTFRPKSSFPLNYDTLSESVALTCTAEGELTIIDSHGREMPVSWNWMKVKFLLTLPGRFVLVNTTGKLFEFKRGVDQPVELDCPGEVQSAKHFMNRVFLGVQGFIYEFKESAFMKVFSEKFAVLQEDDWDVCPNYAVAKVKEGYRMNYFGPNTRQRTILSDPTMQFIRACEEYLLGYAKGGIYSYILGGRQRWDRCVEIEGEGKQFAVFVDDLVVALVGEELFAYKALKNKKILAKEVKSFSISNSRLLAVTTDKAILTDGLRFITSFVVNPQKKLFPIGKYRCQLVDDLDGLRLPSVFSSDESGNTNSNGSSSSSQEKQFSPQIGKKTMQTAKKT